MRLDDIKYYECPMDGEDAVLLVDADSESEPVMDEDGNVLYYCLEGDHYFAVDDDQPLV